MIIQIERSGGFSGIPVHAEVDTRRLEGAESQEVEMLVSASVFFDLPDELTVGGKGRDLFVYRVRIESESHCHSVEVDDASASPELRELIRRVTVLARRLGA